MRAAIATSDVGAASAFDVEAEDGLTVSARIGACDTGGGGEFALDSVSLANAGLSPLEELDACPSGIVSAKSAGHFHTVWPDTKAHACWCMGATMDCLPVLLLE